MNSYYAKLSPEAALKACAASIAIFTVNETVAAAAAVLEEADGAHNQPKLLPPLPQYLPRYRARFWVRMRRKVALALNEPRRAFGRRTFSMLVKVYDQTTPTGRYHSGPLPSLLTPRPRSSQPGKGYFVRVKSSIGT